jgi:glycosyltransferase involved in cell wall biosynthesis
MIIGIDGNEANTIKRVGIGEYANELIQQFSQFRIRNLEFRIYLKEKPLSDLPKEREGWKYRILKPGKLWTQWRLPLDLYFDRKKPDVFFTPSHYSPRFCPVPTAISVMDLSYIHFPKLFNSSDLYQLKNWTAYSVRNSKKILTISKSSKNDIISEYNAAKEKVIVTYPGVKNVLTLNPRVYGMNQIKTKYNISENFILFVGTLQPRKNIVRLIEAVSMLDNKNIELVVVGKKGWLYEDILEAPKKLNIEKRVRFLENVNDEDLMDLYSHARCFVLPSLYEGFGLPVVEAMKAGCPVITSNVSSLPEAGGNACLYVDPEDASDISAKISELIGNEKLRRELIEKGHKQALKFSWEKTAEETLKVLTDLGGSNER